MLHSGHGSVSDRDLQISPAPLRPNPSCRRLFVILLGARSFASYLIEYEWWKEMGQTATWFAMLTLSTGAARRRHLDRFRRALDRARARLEIRRHQPLRAIPSIASIATLALLLVGFLVASASIDTWTVVRYMGSSPASRAPGATRSSPCRSRSTCSDCRSTPCCAATCWPW